MRTPHQGSKRKQGSFFVGLLSLIIEEGGQRVHAFNTICKCSARPKLTLVPPDLSSTFLGMRWYTGKRNGPPDGFILTQASLAHTRTCTHIYTRTQPATRGNYALVHLWTDWHEEQFPKILISTGQRKGYKWKMSELSAPRIFLQRNL